MDYLIIVLTALFASGLTLISGFGLGTILLPAFALFFPVDTAIGMTAVVHLLNNIFKVILLGKYANLKVVLKFGLPAIVTAFAGAWLLVQFSDMPAIYSYSLWENTYSVYPVKLVIALLIALFAAIEIIPGLKDFSFDKKFLPLGGMLSGFFGGLSGHQGALRSAFLVRSGLEKEAFIATGIIIAVFIDVSRLFVYSSKFQSAFVGDNNLLLISAVLAAFLGAFIGRKLMKKITMKAVQLTVSVMLFIIALGLGSGII